MQLRQALARVADMPRPEDFDDFRRHLDPSWVHEALAATGTATLRRRRPNDVLVEMKLSPMHGARIPRCPAPGSPGPFATATPGRPPVAPDLVAGSQGLSDPRVDRPLPRTLGDRGGLRRDQDGDAGPGGDDPQPNPGASAPGDLGVLLAFNLIRLEMVRVAEEAEVEPTRVRFITALHLICDEWIWVCASASPGAIPRHLKRLRADLRRFLLPARRSKRRYPRAVEIKMNSEPKKELK